MKTKPRTKGETVRLVNTACIWLIKTLCLDTNATEAKVNQRGVSHEGKPLGDWEIIIRKNPIKKRSKRKI